MDIKEIRLRDEDTGTLSEPVSLLPKGEEVIFLDNETLLIKLANINISLNKKSITGHKHVKSDISDFPNKLSNFLNDLEFVTKSDISATTHSHPNITILNTINQNLFDSFANKYTRTEVDNKFQNLSAILKTTYSSIIHKHSINDLTDYREPLILSKVSQLTNDSGYINKADLDNLGLNSVYFHSHSNIVSLEKINQILLDGFADKYTKNEMDVKLKSITDIISNSSDLTVLVQTIANKADKNHTHNIIEVNNLQSILDNKAPLNHMHSIYNITGLQTELSNKASSNHLHNVKDIEDVYSIEEVDSLVEGVNNVLATKLNKGNIDGLLKFNDPVVGGYSGVHGYMAQNDFWRIVGFNSGADNGSLEIATGDNGTEPIYFRQYNTGDPNNTIVRTFTILDQYGNTKIPGTLFLGNKTLNEYINDLSLIPGNKNIPTGGSKGDLLGWKSDGEAEWMYLDSEKTTFETNRIKKRGVTFISLINSTNSSDITIDLSSINFYGTPKYSAYIVYNDNTKEQIPLILTDDLLNITHSIKVNINTKGLNIKIIRKNTTVNEYFKIYFEIYDIDNSLTINRATSIRVLNIYPGTTGETFTFTNFNNDTYTMPVTAQVKRWMEEPNDESPKGYGQGLVEVNAVDINDFNIDPYKYLKDINGNWKYDVIYLGAWDCNNELYYNTAAMKSIESWISAGKGYISGHDTLGYSSNLNNELESYVGIKNYANPTGGCSNNKIKITKNGLVNSFPWNLGDINTELIVPLSHVTSQFYTGDVWFKYEPPVGFIETTEVDNVSGSDNFFLGTYKNTAFIQTGHSKGVASADEQKILANVFYYLAGKI